MKEIGRLLSEIARQVARRPGAAPERIAIEAQAAVMEADIGDMNRIGTPSAFSCPACKGALWEVEEGKLKRYRCHVGHSYLPDSLVVDQSEEITTALFTALAAMEEKSAMLRRIAAQMGERLPKEQTRYRELAEDQDRQAALLRQLIRSGGTPEPRGRNSK